MMQLASSRSFLSLGLAVLLLGLVAVPRVEAGVDSSNFTREEWRRLAAGQLVLRPAVQQKGGLRLMGGSSWQVIDAPPQLVWRALLDTAHYGKMMPQVLEARLVRARENVRTVFVRQGTSGVLEASYYLKVQVHEPAQDITFSVDDHMPHDMLKAAWGFYAVRPYGTGDKTLLAYGVMADIGGGPLVSLMRDNVHEWMLRTPVLIKKFVERHGRSIYR
jgi:hypothetical protein